MPASTSVQKLDFNEKLIQSGKGGGTDALLKRLKTLHVKLKDLDQDVVDLKTVHKVTKQLIDPVILHHKDRGVKAFAACCLADILRIYAPDAPYNADQLRDIFQFCIVQLSQNLKLAPSTTRPLAPSKRGQNDSQSQSTLTSNARITEIPYYTEYCYLIDSFANIRSVVLIVDVPGAEDLITTYFDSFVDCVRADMSKQLTRNIVSLLVEVIQEADTVPGGVMECIFNQFENFASKPDTPSFQLIADVCNRAAVKLQRPTFAHFSDIQLSHGRDPSPTDLKILTESHQLLLTIFRNAPNLLLNVVPLLEENLRAADETPLRQLSTQTLGAMFGERPIVSGGVVDLARTYPATWRAWLGRRVDKATSVRVAWVEAARDILVSHPELRKELEPALLERIQDSDERVRAAICKVIGSVDYETALHHISPQFLQAIGQRMSDKKAVVRGEAVTALAKLWSLAQAQLEDNDEDAIAKFEWIPQEMLHAITRAVGAEAKTQISVAFRTHILPLPSKPDDDQAWVDRFLLVATHLDDAGIKALDKLTGIYGYAKSGSPYRAFIEMCEEYKGGAVEQNEHVIKEKLAYVIDAIVRTLFGDTEKARKDLDTFAAANEPRLYKLFKALVDPQTGLRDLIKARNELLRRIEQSHTSILETFTVLIDSAAWMILNHSSIPGLIKRIQRPEGVDPERTTTVAAHYLALIAKHCAPMYKSHVPVLVIVMNDKKNETLVEISLQALAAVCKWNTDCAPTQKGVLERARSLALSGTPRQAKFAARFLVHCKDPKAAKELVSAIWDELVIAGDEELLPLLRAASEIALSAPQTFKEKGEEIGGFVLNDLMNRRSSDDNEDDRWVDDELLHPLDRAKVIGMRVLTHQCLGWARSSNALDLATPTLTFLAQVLVRNGSLGEDTGESGRAQVHLRLRAALCLIKLARARPYDRAMTPHFGELALEMQDPIFMVRHLLLQKLAEVLPNQRLLPRWNLLPILVAIDPEPENRLAARQIMAVIIRTAAQLSTEDRIDRVEMPLARLLHLLSLHPDLDWHDDEALKDIAKFIELFTECVAHRDNVALLFTIATKLKTVSVAEERVTADSEDKIALFTRKEVKEGDGDADDDAKSPTINLYKMSEMAQIILRGRAHQHSWPMSVYPGKIKLPADIFCNLPSPQIAQTVARKTFLPDSCAEWLKNVSTSKKGANSAGPVRRAAPAAERSPREPRERKRKPAGTSKTAAPRKKRRSSGRSATVSDTEDEISSDEDSDEEGSDEEMDVDDEEDEEDEEEDNGVAVMGRGGRRSAKTKAKKAVKKKRKVAKVTPPKKKPPPRAKAKADDSSSELSDLDDE